MSMHHFLSSHFGQNRAVVAALAIAGLCLTAGSAARAQGTTVLTFDFLAGAGISNGSLVPQAYGDNVTASTMGNFTYGGTTPFTPNITTLYSGGATGPSFFTTGYGNLTNVIRAEPGQLLLVTFSPAAGTSVRLNSFDIASNQAADEVVSAIQVFGNGGALLFDRPNVTVPGLGNNPTHLTFLPGVTDSSFLTIQIDARNSTGGSTSIGIDNISFTQVAASAAPEPGSIALCLAGSFPFAGFLTLAHRRRRHRSA